MSNANRAADSAELPFDRLGPYQVVTKLGEGGMGAVYLGRHTVLEVEHAIKVLPDKLAKDPQFVERFTREARSAAKLTHPHIVSVLGADEWEGRRYLAMQYVPGTSLERLVRRDGPVNLHRAVNYAYQTALGLDYAHQRGVVHRDVKPDNVLLDPEETVKLTDFGLVRETQLDEEAANLTQSGTVLGTPYYMSPEQWRGSGVDERSDVFALGVVLYYLLSKRYPYPGQAPAQILHRLMSGEPVPLSEVCEGVDERLCEIVHRTIHPGRDERTPSAAAFADALREWWTEAPGSDSDSQPSFLPTRKEVAPSSSATSRPEVRGESSTLDVAPTVASRRDSSEPAVRAHPAAGVTDTDVSPPLAAQALPVQPVTPPGANGTPLESGSTPGHVGQPTSGPISTVVSSPTVLLIWIGLAAAVAVLTAVAVVIALQVLDEDERVTPSLELAVPLDEGVQARPLYVNEARFAILGRAEGQVRVNEMPFELGSSFELKPGLNRLEVRAAFEDGEESARRTLYVVYDPDAPELDVPLFAEESEVIRREDDVEIAGRVRNEHSPVRVAVSWAEQSEEVRPDEDGRFAVEMPLEEEPQRVRVEATDAAGNRSRISGRLIPDRQRLRMMLGPQHLPSTAAVASDDVVWVSEPELAVAFTLNKTLGVEVTARRPTRDGEEEALEVDLDTDGVARFSVRDLVEGHNPPILVEARDAIGHELIEELVIRVAPHPPRIAEISVAGDADNALPLGNDGETLRVALAEVPATLELQGRMLEADGVEVILDGEEPLDLDEQGRFTHEFEAEALEERHRFAVVARDPLGRSTERDVRVEVVERLYTLLGTNEQGYEEYRRLRDGATVVRIPAGEYTVGLEDGSVPNAPERTVALSAYLIDKYEVSVEQYATFLNETGITWEEALEEYLGGEDTQELYAELRYSERHGWRAGDGFESYPLSGVTWHGARAYARWATNETGDLPSEVQWEVAARGPEAYHYPWGNDRPFPGVANYHGGGFTQLRPVTQFSDGASPFGVYNMAGNVEQWCLDWFSSDAYYGFHAETQDPVQSTAVPGARRARVVRGGSLESTFVPEFRAPEPDGPSFLFTWARQSRVPHTVSAVLGFRAAGSADAPGILPSRNGEAE